MTKNDFDEWLENPVTEYVFQYLKDSISNDTLLLANDIAYGSIVEEVKQVVVATRFEKIKAIIEIQLEEIETFYREEMQDGGIRQ